MGSGFAVWGFRLCEISDVRRQLSLADLGPRIFDSKSGLLGSGFDG